MRISMALLFVFAFLSQALPAQACWEWIPLPAVIGANPVVVTGEITAIDLAESQADKYVHDTAYITVSEVLKNELAGQTVVVGSRLALSIPSAGNTMQISTDIRYRHGQAGIWILEFRDGSYWATYPGDFQVIDRLAAVRDIVAAEETSGNE